MPSDTDQRSERTRRGTLIILVLAAAIGVGLWYVLERPDPASGQPGSSEPASDAASEAGDARTAGTGASQTADSGTTSSEGDLQTTDASATAPADATRTRDAGTTDPTGVAQSTDAGTADPTGVAQSTDAGTADPTGVAQSTGSGVDPTGVTQTTDSGAVDPTGVAQSTGSDVADPTGVAQTTDAGTADPTGVVQSTDAGAGAVSGTVQAAETDTAAPTGAAQTADAGTTGDAQQIAAVEPAAATAKEKLVLAPATESIIERVPIDAPPATDTTGETGILAIVDDVVERIETTIREQLATEPEVNPDKQLTEPEVDPEQQLHVQVTYDDSQGDATQAGVEPNEAAQTPDSGTSPLSDAAQTTDSGVGAVSGTVQTAETDTAAPTDPAQTTNAGTTGDAQQIATVDPATVSAKEKLVLAPAPESTVERVPIDAPPATDPTGETGVLAIIDDVVERIETTVRERLATDSEVDPEVDPEEQLDVQVTYDDSQGDATQEQLNVQVTYDDSQEDATQAGVEPNETAQTADTGSSPRSDPGQTTDSTAAPPVDDAQTADSGVMAPSDTAGSTRSADAAPSDVTRTADSDAVEAEAEANKYVETLTDTAPRKIPVDKADHFVTQDHVLALVPEDTIESVSVDELAKDETLDPDTPITVVRESEEMEIAVPERLIAESGGDLDTKLQVLVRYDDTEDAAEQEDMKPGDGEPSDAEQTLAALDEVEPENVERTVAQPDTVERITVREVLERILAEPEKPITLIKKVRYFEVMTLRELLETETDTDTFLTVVRRPYRIEAATLADLLQRKKAENPDTIFYIHTVQSSDVQGIWGIVHYGIIDNFARGVALERGEEIETYTVQIPRDADERLADQSSSFLGKLIDHKTKDSYVYNYRDHRMGRNPDRIYPGQELVIINFEPEELRSIYKHFATG